MSNTSMASGTTRGKAISCCFLGQELASARGRSDAASDWAGFCATIIKRRRDGASAVSVFWPYEMSASRSEAEVTYRQSALNSVENDPLADMAPSAANCCLDALGEQERQAQLQARHALGHLLEGRLVTPWGSCRPRELIGRVVG